MAGSKEVAYGCETVNEAGVKEVFASIIELVKKGEKVRINGFGTFERKHVEARVGRNPKTSEEVDIPAKDKLTFKPQKGIEVSAPKTGGRRR